MELLLEILGGATKWRDTSSGGSQGFRATQIDVGGETIEVIEPSGPDSFLVKYLDKRGPGLHHLTWYVSDLDGLVKSFDSQGVRMVDMERKNGAIVNAFIHPKSAFGVLVQFRPLDAAKSIDRKTHPSTQDLPAPAPSRGVLHHSTIATPNRLEALHFFQSFLGGVEAQANLFGDFYGQELQMSGPQLGFISPAAPTSFVAKFIEERGPGLHHLAFRMTDMEAALDAAKRRGIRLVNASPKEGPVDDVFLHPRDMYGALIRLQRRK